MKVLDLFSGIGGFALGLERAGMETVAFCEYDEKARLVLKKHWPDVPMYNDVRTLTGEQLEKDGITDIGLICGGYPCQPFSVAGKRKGQADDRHLWPEFFRLIKEIRPTWVIAENVAGHINMGLDSVLADLESEAYQCQTFLIGACAVDAQHRRYRVWIVAWNSNGGNVGKEREIQERESTDSCGICTDVAYSELTGSGEDNGGTDRGRSETESEAVQQENGEAYASDVGKGGKVVAHSDSVNWSPNEGKPNAKADGRDKSSGGGKVVAYTECQRQQGQRINERSSNTTEDKTRQASWFINGSERRSQPGNWLPEPSVGRVANGVPGRVDRLKQLGNAVVPQIPEVIGRFIMEIENGA